MLSPSQTQKELQRIIVYKDQNRQNNLVSTIGVVVTFEEEGSGRYCTDQQEAENGREGCCGMPVTNYLGNERVLEGQ